MKSIRIKDLEIVEQEKQQSENAEKSTAETLVQLSIENKKKDALIAELTQTVADMNIKIAKLKEEPTNEK